MYCIKYQKNNRDTIEIAKNTIKKKLFSRLCCDPIVSILVNYQWNISKNLQKWLLNINFPVFFLELLKKNS